MRSNRTIPTLLYFLTVLVLASCAPAAAPDTAAPAKTLESHLQALAARNEGAFSSSLCSDWEAQAFLEYDAYQGVKAELKDLTCSSAEVKAGEAQVICQGKIALSYGKENQEVDLSRRVYRMIASNEGWRVCGFSERAGGAAGSR